MIRTPPRTPCTWDKVPVTFNADYAALLLSVSRRTVLYWCRMGDIPARKIGKYWTFDKDVIRSWMSGTEVQS